ncbi:hypothetical protein AB0G04_36160 [Actinoplanes sp. NPDC023801]|uniref:hypothetical protein n=1 Tax=Actinoplanes sp. NPDC023801 TaxID=3154595 RepID=UPI0033D69138
MTSFDTVSLADWRRIRRYAVPQRMITECGSARERGDWRAACAAARFDVDFDPELAGEAAERAAHLAPDLLRWHLPRTRYGSTTLVGWNRYLLIPDERVGPRTVLLTVRTPDSMTGTQRLTLEAVRGASALRGGQAVPVPAYLWDARHASGLRAALGGSADRLPLFTPAGDPLSEDLIGTGDDLPARAERVWRAPRTTDALAEAGLDVGDWLADTSWLLRYFDVTRLDHDIRWLAARLGGSVWGVYGSSYAYLKIRVDAEPMRVSWVGGSLRSRDRDVLPPGTHLDMLRSTADLELIRRGRLSPGDLHPLVRAVLFPGTPAPPPEPDLPLGGELVRVRCGGVWHEIEVRLGRLDPLAHTPEERQRERAMRAFGGTVTGCFEVENIWYGAPGRLPRQLRAYRIDLWQRLVHGGTRLLNELLDAGLDPHLRDSAGGTVIHQLKSFDHRLLLPRLLAEGVDINARDRAGLTALHRTVVEQGPPDLIIALIDAGADVSVCNREGETVFAYAKKILRTWGNLNDDYQRALQHLLGRSR